MNAVTKPYLALPIRMPLFQADAFPGHRARLGVGDIEDIVLADEDAARPAELLPLVDEFPLLVEDLNPIVTPVRHE